MQLSIKLLIFACIGSALFSGCKTTQDDIIKQIEIENKKFLTADGSAEEVFRILLTSDTYTVFQMKYNDMIKKSEDAGGDKYMTEEIKRLDIIEETREAVVSIWLYPDSGKIMKIRPKKLTYLTDLDKLIPDDIQRWNFIFPKNYINPTKFDIKYRIVLRKKQSDEEIIREVQKRMNDGR